MRLRVKALALTVSMAMLCSLLVPIATFAAETENVFWDDFESYSIGAKVFSGFGGGAKTNIWGIAQDKDTSNKYLRMTLNTTSDMHLDKNFSTSVTGKFVIEARLRFMDNGSVTKYIELRDNNNKDYFPVKFLPNGSVALQNGTVIAGYVTDKFYTVALAIDTDNSTFDVYFNGKRRASKQDFTGFAGLKMLRIHMRDIAGESTMDVDDVYIYSGEKPLSNEEKLLLGGADADVTTESEDETPVSDINVKRLMGDKVALYMRKPNALVYGEKTYITPERDTAPVYRGEENPMLPLRFFAETIGAEVGYNSTNNAVTVKKGDKTLEFVIGKQSFIVNGVSVALAVPTENIGGKAFAPANELCDAFGINLFYDEGDLLIYSKNKINLSWDNNLEEMRKISESFVFDDVTGAQIVQLMREKHPNNGHPRMIMSKEKFDYIRNEISKGNDGDPVYRKAYSYYKQLADKYLAQKPAFYEIRDGIRLLYVSQEVLEKVIVLSVMYNITLEEKYAIRARQELIAVCSFQDWHPYHFLDVGEMTTAVALGYDWLYDFLDEADRALIRKAIVTNAFDAIIEDYDEVPTRSRTWIWRGNPVCNWRFIAGGGTAVGAIAIADELEGEDLKKAERVLEQSLLDIRPAISLFAPDGGYEEGLGYWDYANKYFVFHVGSLKSATGTDFGYLDAPGLRHTANFSLTMQGTVSQLAYHDKADSQQSFSSLIMFWAKEFNDYGVAVPIINYILTNGAKLETLFYYDPEFMKAANTQLPIDSIHRAVGTYSARSSFDRDGIWVGYHVDDAYAGPSHDHMDAGTFLLDANGENFFCELGSDNYNLPKYQCDAYVTRAEGHNTFVINPDAGYDMKFGGKASFNEYESKERGSFVTADLTDLYSDHAVSAWRGVKLDNFRRTVYVQDEIVMKGPSEYYWFGHTRADIQISEDGKTAILTLNGKKLIAEILNGDGAVFSVMEAKPLPTSPKLEGQKDLSAFQKLTVHMSNVESVNLTIAFNAYDAFYDETTYSREFVPMAQWQIPDGENKIEYVTADSITIDGKPLEGFDPEKTEYDVELTSFDRQSVVEATAQSEVTITPYTGIKGSTVVSVARSGDKNRRNYTINFSVPGYIGTPEGKSAITPVKTTVSDTPQPENHAGNTMDDDYGTRWSCVGESWIEYDLGGVYSLDSVAVSFMNGDQRTAQFDIELSTDGVNYTKYYEGDALSTLELESHRMLCAQARYVRINCYGWNGNRNNWNSITEAKIFKN